MDKNTIWENITNKITGEYNNADEKAVQEWINSDKENKKVFNRLLQIWEFNPKQFHDNSTIYHKFKNRKNQFGKRKTVRPFVYYALQISAVLFFVISLVFLTNYLFQSKNNELVYQQISVPKGSRSSFNLPDGTKVWLSNNSIISFPSKFTGNTRELKLEGEAYFEVTHNKKKPFIVNIGPNRIQVLGTRFSVTAYPGDNEVRADLVEGKIQFDIRNKEDGFNSYMVKPSHSLVLDQSSGRVYEAKVPDGFYEYWHKGIYEFRNETLEDLAVRIDRIYNTQIIFQDEVLKSKRFSGTISIDDNIFTFIEAVKSTSIEPIDYKYEKNKLYIKLN
ncbi:FecR domain-containing protein [Prolixibacteraceae bacterium Z1-6]|uniref:FecR domain-containing protein n=1 Tax=Draconibacterium aestuarii TaxID=2998507 RepID=A0A9X3J5F1_9BACT|nr:FecR domain-containing protein [Prolixibacteraceae bacterium Z1-6]